MIKYNHEEKVHNLKSPKIIVPEIIKLLNPKSVVDIGCGLGTFINVFKQSGISDVLGVDGAWVNKDLLYQNLNRSEFFECDLEKEIKLHKKYDLVVSLEVAEHISKNSADIFVKNLVDAGNLILFSAAIPNQGGQNHINEQWLTYWEEKFAIHNYVVHDIIRPIFWDNPEVFWWYKQNMVLIAPEDFKLNYTGKTVPMKNIIHYELYLQKEMEVERIIKGKKNTAFYLKLLVHSIFDSNSIKNLKLLLKRNKKR